MVWKGRGVNVMIGVVASVVIINSQWKQNLSFQQVGVLLFLAK